MQVCSLRVSAQVLHCIASCAALPYVDLRPEDLSCELESQTPSASTHAVRGPGSQERGGSKGVADREHLMEGRKAAWHRLDTSAQQLTLVEGQWSECKGVGQALLRNSVHGEGCGCVRCSSWDARVAMLSLIQCCRPVVKAFCLPESLPGQHVRQLLCPYPCVSSVDSSLSGCSFITLPVFLLYQLHLRKDAGGCAGLEALAFNAAFNLALLLLFVQFYRASYSRRQTQKKRVE